MDSGPTEVAPGVWRATASMDAPGGVSSGLSVNAYVIVDGDEACFIDTAWWYEGEPSHLDGLIKAVGIGDLRTQYLVLTHSHRDHSGWINYLEERTGARPWLHRAEVDAVKSMEGFSGLRTREAAEAWYRSHGFDTAFARHIVSSKVRDTTIDVSHAVWGQSGSVIRIGGRAFEVVHSPGHTNGHICLFEAATGILFSGDALLPRGYGNPHVTVRPLTLADPLTPYLESLKYLEAQGPSVCLPGHGPVVDDVHELIASHRSYVDKKLRIAESCIDEQPATAYEITRRLPWRGGKKRFDELVSDELFLAFGDTLARIRRLVTLGRVQASDEPVTRYWRS